MRGVRYINERTRAHLLQQQVGVLVSESFSAECRASSKFVRITQSGT